MSAASEARTQPRRQRRRHKRTQRGCAHGYTGARQSRGVRKNFSKDWRFAKGFRSIVISVTETMPTQEIDPVPKNCSKRQARAEEGVRDHSRYLREDGLDLADDVAVLQAVRVRDHGRDDVLGREEKVA